VRRGGAGGGADGGSVWEEGHAGRLRAGWGTARFSALRAFVGSAAAAASEDESASDSLVL